MDSVLGKATGDLLLPSLANRVVSGRRLLAGAADPSLCRIVKNLNIRETGTLKQFPMAVDRQQGHAGS